MNSTRTAEPELTSALSEGRDLVGVALFPLSPVYGNPIAAALFHHDLEARLRAFPVDPTDNAGMFGLGFIVWTTWTEDRNPVLRAIEHVIKEMGLWEICELAYFDKAEDYWRTIHPYGAPPFDRFFTPDNFRFAKERLDLYRESLPNIASDVLRLLRRIKEEGS
jgi:hypothetical protein